MRRSLALVGVIWMLIGASAPAILAASCPTAGTHPCCVQDQAGGQFTRCRTGCACDELTTAPRAVAIVREAAAAPGPFAGLPDIVGALHVSPIAPQLDVPPEPPDRSSAVGPPLRLRI